MRFQSDLLGIHDSSHTHSQRHGGNLGEVVTKETSIGQNGVLGKGLHSGSGNKAGAWFIERNVAIRADTCSETKKSQAETEPKSPITQQERILILIILNTINVYNLRQTTRPLQPLRSSAHMLDTLPLGLQHFHPGCEHWLARCLCA